MARGSTGSARKAALRRSRPAETIIASLGGLDPGASATIAIVVVPTTNDPWSATAVVLDYFSDDLAPANNEVTLAIGGATPASPTPGSPVVVSLAAGTDGTRPATLTFSDVTAAGTTTLTTSTTAPPLPAGYEVLGTYYDIQTSASYSGSITLCFSYADPAPTDLLHYENNAWVVVPSVAANHQICGTTTSLSPFALVTRTSPPVLTVPTDLARTADGPTGAVVSYVATAMDYLGKPVTPASSPASGSLFPVGTTKVTCTATDAGGRSSSASFSVTVGYRFAGFFQPLNDPATNPPSVFKSGSTIPVKFALTYTNGTPILDTAAAAIATACGATISLTQTAGTTPAVDESVASTTATTGACFWYDSTAHLFFFNLGTKGRNAPSPYTLQATIVWPGIVGPDQTLRSTHSLAIGLR